eukprot:2637340-Rhodomonas_salina.5
MRPLRCAAKPRTTSCTCTSGFCTTQRRRSASQPAENATLEREKASGASRWTCAPGGGRRRRAALAGGGVQPCARAAVQRRAGVEETRPARP